MFVYFFNLCIPATSKEEWPGFRAAPILPAIFFEKQEVKRKEQNSGKIGENLEKWGLRTVNQPILHCKDGDTLHSKN